jgi:MraZ protein
MAFRGINAINIDDKGRLALPKRYRDHLQQDQNGKMIITIDTEEPCLLLYPFTAWVEIETKVAALPTFNNFTRRIQRLLIGHATEVELDSSGRILVPQLLREYAKLNKNAIIVGQGKKFEVWDETEWHKKRDVWLNEGLNNVSGEILPEDLQNISL